MEEKKNPAVFKGCPRKPIPKPGRNLKFSIPRSKGFLKHDSLHGSFKVCGKSFKPLKIFANNYVGEKKVNPGEEKQVQMKMMKYLKKMNGIMKKMNEIRIVSANQQKTPSQIQTNYTRNNVQLGVKRYCNENLIRQRTKTAADEAKRDRNNISLNTTSISLKCAEDIRDEGPRKALMLKEKRPAGQLSDIRDSEEEESQKSIVVMEKNEVNMKRLSRKSISKERKNQYPITIILSPARETEKKETIERDPLEMVTHFLKRLLENCTIDEENLEKIRGEFHHIFNYKFPENIENMVKEKIANIKAEVKVRSYKKLSLKKETEEDHQTVIFKTKQEENKKEDNNLVKNQSPKKNGEKNLNKKTPEVHSKKPKNPSSFGQNTVSNNNENLPENILPAIKEKDKPMNEKFQASAFDLADNRGIKEKQTSISLPQVTSTKLNPPESFDFKKQAHNEEEVKCHDIPFSKHEDLSKNLFEKKNISSSKKKEESKESHFPLEKVNEPHKEPPKNTHFTKAHLVKPIVPDKIPIHENKGKSPQKEIQKIDPHPTNSNIPITPLQVIQEVAQQLENQTSSNLPPPLMAQDPNRSNLQLFHTTTTENNANLPDLKSINSKENSQINVDIMNAKGGLEQQISPNNLSNANAVTNLNTDMNTSQIIFKMEDREATMDFSCAQPSNPLNQILQNPPVDNPFLQITTTMVPPELQNMFNPNAVPNAPIFPQNQNNIFSNDQPQPMLFQQNSNLPFFNYHHSQTMNYQNQPNVFRENHNRSFLESTNNMETNGNLNEISFGHGPEIQMSNPNDNNIYDPRMMMPNQQNNQPNFHGIFGQNNNNMNPHQNFGQNSNNMNPHQNFGQNNNNMNPHQNLFPNPNNHQNNHQMMGAQSNLFNQNHSQSDNAKNMFLNKPNNNNNLNYQPPIAAHNIFAPQNNNLQNPKNYVPSGDPTQDRMLNKKNENAKLRANNRNY